MVTCSSVRAQRLCTGRWRGRPATLKFPQRKCLLASTVQDRPAVCVNSQSNDSDLYMTATELDDGTLMFHFSERAPDHSDEQPTTASDASAARTGSSRPSLNAMEPETSTKAADGGSTASSESLQRAVVALAESPDSDAEHSGSDTEIDFDIPNDKAGLRKLTVRQLKSICKVKRLSGYSKLRKNELIQHILTQQ